MEVLFKTNIDKFRFAEWPKMPPGIVPRTSERIEAIHLGQYSNQGLPNYLIVTQVTYKKNHIICDLWYDAITVKAYEFSDVKLL